MMLTTRHRIKCHSNKQMTVFAQNRNSGIRQTMWQNGSCDANNQEGGNITANLELPRRGGRYDNDGQNMTGETRRIPLKLSVPDYHHLIQKIVKTSRPGCDFMLG